MQKYFNEQGNVICTMHNLLILITNVFDFLQFPKTPKLSSPSSEVLSFLNACEHDRHKTLLNLLDKGIKADAKYKVI